MNRGELKGAVGPQVPEPRSTPPAPNTAKVEIFLSLGEKLLENKDR